MTEERRARMEIQLTHARLRVSVPPRWPLVRAAASLILVYVAPLLIGAWWGDNDDFPVISGVLAAWVFLFALLLAPLLQTTIIDLGRDAGTLERKPFRRKRQLRARELRVCLFDRAPYPGRASADQVVKLEDGIQSFHLLDGYREDDQRQVVDAIDSWLRSRELGSE